MDIDGGAHQCKIREFRGIYSSDEICVLDLNMKSVVLLVSFIFCGVLLWSQNGFYVDIDCPDCLDADLNEWKKNLSQVPDLESLGRALNKLQQNQWAGGYLGFSVDGVDISGDSCYVALYVGRRYNNIEVRLDNESVKLLRRENILDLDKNYRFKNIAEFISLMQQWQQKLSEQSYLYGAIEMSMVKLLKNELVAELSISLNRAIRIKELVHRGRLPITANYLEKVTGIKPLDPFNERKVSSVNSVLNNISFIEATTDPHIKLYDDLAEIAIFPNKKKANALNILLGLLPQQNLSTVKYRLTGQVSIDLWNILHYGENFKLEYFNLQENSPELHVLSSWPYIFRSDFGVAGSFDLFKSGEDYIKLNYKGQLDYLFDPEHRVGVNWETEQSQIINPDTLAIVRNGTLPAHLDYVYHASGLSYYFGRLDYRFNPQRGWKVETNLQIGLRKINAHQVITEQLEPFDSLSQIYTNLQENALLPRITMSCDYYLPTARKQCLKFGVSGASWLGDELISENQEFLVGGLHTFRGFNENQFRAATWGLLNTEYRFISGRDAHISIFHEIGYIDPSSTDHFVTQAIGAGLQIRTQIGVFHLLYGLGRDWDSSFSFKTGKIHFGYTALF